SPFFTPSVHVDVHTPPTHLLLAQSTFTRHAAPSAHLIAHLPPQSTSVSTPFFTASVHVTFAHTWPMHTRLWQSEPAAHPCPVPQGAQSGPPQSIPVSPPFFTRSTEQSGYVSAATTEPPGSWSSAGAGELPVQPERQSPASA